MQLPGPMRFDRRFDHDFGGVVGHVATEDLLICT